MCSPGRVSGPLAGLCAGGRSPTSGEIRATCGLIRMAVSRATRSVCTLQEGPMIRIARQSRRPPERTSSDVVELQQDIHRARDAERHCRIAEAAYRRAEERGFAPGLELDDWLAAETELSSDGAPNRS